MRQRAHLRKERRWILLHRVSHVSSTGLEFSGAEFLEFELAAVAAVVVIVVAAVIFVGGRWMLPAPRTGLRDCGKVMWKATWHNHRAAWDCYRAAQSRRSCLGNFRRGNIDRDAASTAIDNRAISLDAHQPAGIRDVL